MIKYLNPKNRIGYDKMKLNIWIFMFLLAVSSAYAVCVTPTNGQTFTTNTDICAGTHSLSLGVVIGASNIYLNCSGATFNGVTASGNVGITATGRQNIQILNCKEINYATGVRFTRTHNSTIVGLNTTNSINSRITDFVNSSDNTIRNSNLTHDAGHGVNLNTASRRNIVRNNIIKADTGGSGGFPVVIDTNSDNNQIHHNRIDSRVAGGNSNVVTIQTNSDRNIIDHNNITILAGSGSVMYGIRMDNVNGNNITFNRIIEGAGSNNLGSLQVNADNSYIADNFIFTTSSNAYGLLLTSASAGSILLRNNITTTGTPNSPAIQLDTNSNNVQIINNSLSVAGTNPHILLATILNATIQDNIFRGTNTAVSVFSASTYNLIIGSMRFMNKTTTTTRASASAVFSTNRLAGVNSSLEPSLNRSARITFLGYDSRFTPEIRRISAFRTSLPTVLAGAKCPANICTAISYQNQILTFNVSSFSTYGISPCTNITNGMTVNNSILVCPGTYNFASGVKVGASNIIIACNNTATLDGNDVFGSPGILINGQFNNITIDGCTLKDYGYGIFLNKTDNNTIVNNTFISNTNSGINGITTSDNLIIGNNHTIQNFILFTAGVGEFNRRNIISSNRFSNNVGSPSVWLTRSRDSIIENNIGSSTSTSNLINLQSSNNITVRNNTLGPTLAVCLEANTTVTNSSFIGNTVRNCGTFGIQLTATSRFRVENNTVRNSDVGVRLFSDANNHVFRNNIIFNSTNEGILTGQTANHNLFEGNNISNSGSFGIYLNSDNGFNTVRSNILRNSGSNEIYLDFTRNNNISNNDIFGTGGSGITIADSNNTIARNNTVSDLAGFDLVRFNNVDVIGNTIIGSTGVGTGIFSGSPGPISNSDLLVEGNTVRNHITGITVDGDTSIVTVRNNIVSQAVLRGFLLQAIDGTSYFINNTARNTLIGFRLVSMADAFLINNTVTNVTTVGISFETFSENNTVEAPINFFSNNGNDIRTLASSGNNTLKLTANNGFLRFDKKNLNISDISSNLFIDNSIIAVNSASEPGLNRASSVRLEVNSCSDNDLFIKSGFQTNINNILSAGTLCVGGQCSSVVCSGNTLTFNTNGFSSYAWGTSQTQGSITTTLLLSILLILYILMTGYFAYVSLSSGEIGAGIFTIIVSVIILIVFIPVIASFI